MSLEIDTNAHELVGCLDELARRLVPYATAVALTRIAQRAQKEVRANLPKRFQVRRPWIQQGIRILAAKKSQWPTPEAVVGSRDAFMVLQETGGTKRPGSGTHLAFPTERVRTGAKGSIPKGKRPMQVIGTRRTFKAVIKTGSNAGKLAVLRRSEKDRYPLQVLYVFGKKADVPARFGFAEEVTQVAAKHFGNTYAREFEKAVRNARGRFSGRL